MEAPRATLALRGGGLLRALLASTGEIVRVLAIIHLEPDLEILGPFGSYLLETSGVWDATRILVSARPLMAALSRIADRADLADRDG